MRAQLAAEPAPFWRGVAAGRDYGGGRRRLMLHDTLKSETDTRAPRPQANMNQILGACRLAYMQAVLALFFGVNESVPMVTVGNADETIQIDRSTQSNTNVL